MKRIFTYLLFALSMTTMPLLAQDIDESFVFIDENGTVIEDGATVVRNVVELYDEEEGTVVINSGLSVKNMTGSSDYIKMIYEVERIDNGSYQICFPTTCNMQEEVGAYETAVGQLMGEVQNIMSEWFPVADGECVVTLTIELFMKQGLFPPTYVHKAYGPTITLRFVKGELPPEPIPGDVNGDSEVNIADVNALIDKILSQSGDEKCDVNSDGEVNIADVNALIDLILS